MPIHHKVVTWYRQYERPLYAFSLFGGFAFDAFTLHRVDALWENLWLILHLVVVAVVILVVNRKKEDDNSEFEFWMVGLLQFAYGGLLSAFLVFYFRGATLSVSWPFLLLLALVFFMNERFKEHYSRLTFQVSLLFLSIYLFMIFAVPVLVGTIGPWIFILSGVLSLFLVHLFLKILERFSKDKLIVSRNSIRFSVLGVFALMNIFYFTNIIPPLPVSLHEGGIYRSVVRDPSGGYIFDSGPRNWFDYFSLYPTVHARTGDSLYAYTAIFSPASFSTSVIHEWERYNEEGGRWIEMSRISLDINGGREEGYRTYSVSRVNPGKWRVNVRTPSGQVVGRLNFRVVL